MFEDLLTSLTSGGVLGGLLGTVGSIFTKRQDRLLLRDKNAHDLQLLEFGLKEQELEIKGLLAVEKSKQETATIEAERDIEVAGISAFQESIKAAAVASGIKWVDAIRSLMRPTITTALLVTYLWLMFKAYRFTGGVQGATFDELLYNSVEQLIFLTTMCISWWFGHRPSGGIKTV